MVEDRAGASFLAAFDTSTDQGRLDAARMLSAASGPSSGWVTALPGATSTRLGDGDAVFAGSHRLSLGVATSIVTQHILCGVTDDVNLNHAMVRKPTARMATLRHNVWASGVVPSLVQGALPVQNRATVTY